MADGAVISSAAITKKDMLRLIQKPQSIPAAATIYKLATKTGKANLYVPLHISHEIKPQNPFTPTLPPTKDKVNSGKECELFPTSNPLQQLRRLYLNPLSQMNDQFTQSPPPGIHWAVISGVSALD